MAATNAVEAILQGATQITNALVSTLQLIWGYGTHLSNQPYQQTASVVYGPGWAVGAEGQESVRVTQEGHLVVYAISASMDVLALSAGASAVGQVVAGPYPAAAATGERISPTICAGGFDYLLTAGSSDRQQMNDWVPAPAGLGPGSHPYKLMRPWFIPGNSNIRLQTRINFASVDANESVRISFVFHGLKIYDPESMDLTRRI